MKTLREMCVAYVLYVAMKCKKNEEVAKILDISERTVGTYLRDGGFSFPLGGRHKSREIRGTVKVGEDPFDCMRNLTPEERDFFENLDSPAFNYSAFVNAMAREKQK